MKLVILFVMLSLPATAQTNKHQENIPAQPVVTTNWVPQASNWRRFGNQIIDLSRPNDLVKLKGKPTSELNSNVTFDVYVDKVIPGTASGLGGIGAYSGGGLATSEAFSHTVVVTNFPNIQHVDTEKVMTIQAKRIGTTKVKNNLADYYDCGTPWVVMIIKTNATK